MISIESFVPAEYTVWAVAGAIFVTGLLDVLSVLLAQSKPANRFTLQLPRSLMFIGLAFWGASLILPLNLLWGPTSVVAGYDVTSWTSQGWMCRIFLTVCLGICAPLTCILGAMTLCWIVFYINTNRMLSSGRTVPKPNKGVAMVLDHPTALTLLVALPFGAAQAVIAWISLSLTYDENSIEESTTSLISTWLAPFSVGTDLQCGTSSVNGEYPCTACLFPAASVLVHGVWTILYSMVLVFAAFKLRELAHSSALKQKALLTTGVLGTCSVAGLICMGITIYYHNPFTWEYQGLWLGYVASVLGTTVGTSYLLDSIHKLARQQIQ
jgi:hypothetical protein